MDGIYLRIGKYTLSQLDQDLFWLESDDGEGMQVFSRDLHKLIDGFFNENYYTSPQE